MARQPYYRKVLGWLWQANEKWIIEGWGDKLLRCARLFHDSQPFGLNINEGCAQREYDPGHGDAVRRAWNATGTVRFAGDTETGYRGAGFAIR
jgi:hypothetical protein